MSDWLDGTALAAIPNAAASALLAGALLPPLGAWVVFSRVVFLGITLAQVAAAGVALGLFLGGPALPLGLAGCALLLVPLVRRLAQGGSSGDSSLGAAFCAASALALLFISRSPADLDRVEHILHGNLIFATRAQVLTTGAVLLSGLALVALFFRRILFCAFDPETAQALGLSPRGWLALLYGVLALALTVSMRTTGALLTFALLVLPPLAALGFGRGLRATLWLASAFGLLGAAAGLALAVVADLHVESSIVTCSFLLLPLCRLWRRAPPLALLGAGLLGALAPQLAPDPAAPFDLHDAADPPAHADPWHADVHLDPRRSADGRDLLVSWSLEMHKDAPDARIPSRLWLVLTGDGVAADAALLTDTAHLPLGVSHHEGRLVIAGAGRLARLSGQVWSGPPTALDALPVDEAHVTDGIVR